MWDRIPKYCSDCKHVGHEPDSYYAFRKNERPKSRLPNSRKLDRDVVSSPKRNPSRMQPDLSSSEALQPPMKSQIAQGSTSSSHGVPNDHFKAHSNVINPCILHQFAPKDQASEWIKVSHKKKPNGHEPSPTVTSSNKFSVLNDISNMQDCNSHIPLHEASRKKVGIIL